MVMFPSTVSIITPSFNQARFIEATIRSVLGQTYPNVEHIIIDGGSTDGTLDILRKYNQRIKWISEPDNGQGDAVNKGFALAQGGIVGWINSDDFYFSPTVVEHIVEVFDTHTEVELVYCGIAYVDPHGRLLHVRIPPRFSWDRLKRIAYIGNSNAFYRRSVIERHKIDPAYHFVLDHEFMLRVTRECRVLRTTEIIACFRVHPDAKTQTLSWESKDWERKERNLAHEITSGFRHSLLTWRDRAIFKAQLVVSDFRWRHLWHESPPYYSFLKSATQE